MGYVCNPLNIPYTYQFFDENGVISSNREAADPSMVLYNGKYLLFPSMTAGFLSSDNLSDWEFHLLNDVPIFDYAPDVRVIGEYLYFSASDYTKNCSFYRTKDPFNGSFEEINGTFPFWDPNLFVDYDDKIYFYWGCTNNRPIYGVEMNPVDMSPIGDPVELIFGDVTVKGYERTGENHVLPRSSEQIEEMVEAHMSNNPDTSEEMKAVVRQWLGNDPYIEGAWMDKHNGQYYFQYASPGTEYNIYSDGVYVSDKPLGPFKLAKNNPFSYKPGGFMPGAGHGSTMEDKHGNVWHASSMRISVNHQFERRVGIWPAGFDEDGELFCNQRFGDWPMRIDQTQMDPWEDPEWMLLSYNKPASSSSYEAGKDASKATDENVRTWWKAAGKKPGEWLEVDLLHECDVRAIHINFADDQTDIIIPESAEKKMTSEASNHTAIRYIDRKKHYTRWLLEGSINGEHYFTIADKSNAESDLPHDLIIPKEGVKARYIKCTVQELPYRQVACISGLRVFGTGEGNRPVKARNVRTELASELDLNVSWEKHQVVGHNVIWGFSPDKLYHSYMVLGSNEVKIGALVKGQSLFVRVDSFNETGVTEGDIIQVI
ncbi:family 43 glycosylhydrolase [Paenibacillus segetis]|uniref:Endo-1,4-beta-xylanase n=1 Tax=Paenibacillus segetis TaxID=1325360 RepID=A0ABQ1YQN3_9BACL|nr:family 43 glycosylhydrolase [Paenibacillus segetis]GGH35066.1 endo-1,4-beta-xylanase [Paenibacillus segetis]